MPTLQVSILEGYSNEEKQHLTESLVNTVTGVLNAPADGVVVWLNEAKPAEYRRGHQQRKPGKPSALPADQIVHSYLSAMEARDLNTAKSFLADSFIMTFPGGASFSQLEDLVTWSKDRYRFVKKTFHSTSTSYGVNTISVTCTGVLHGEWPNGEVFEGVRFIDLFQIKNGKLIQQEVWNDLALAMKSST